MKKTDLAKSRKTLEEISKMVEGLPPQMAVSIVSTLVELIIDQHGNNQRETYLRLARHYLDKSKMYKEESDDD